MELSDLRCFCAVVEAGGVIGAARRLHRVPSAVSTRLRGLEDKLGVPLFIREAQRLRLSEAGSRLHTYALQLLSLADEARQAVVAGPARQALRLGSMESTAAARLPKPLAQLHARHPEIDVELHIGAPPELKQRVAAGELDAAFVAEPVGDPRLASVCAFREELLIVTAPSSQPVRRPTDLARPTMLAFHEGCPYRQRLEAWFERSGMQPDRVVELASYHAILGCVAAGMGVALMPRSVLATFPERRRLGQHPLTGRMGSIETRLVWPRTGLSASVSALRKLLA
jgi:DNA-binding transcriptional LysR family regulator